MIDQQQAPMPQLQNETVATETKSTASLPHSEPTNVRIPSIKVDSALINTGLNADGSPAVPTGADVDKAAWLTASASPGETGTSVIIGHVDTLKSGPSVFFELGKLLPGQKVYVSRQDGQTAVFTVSAVRAYDQDNFPNQTVYGNADSPVLRLITCGGTWDASKKQYSENIVVFAALSEEK